MVTKGPNSNPVNVLRAAVKAVPAVKYATGIAGVAAAVAIVLGFTRDPKIATFGVMIMIALMFVLVIFAYATKNLPGIKWLAAFMAWAIAVLFVVALACVFSAVAFDVPASLAQYLKGVSGGVSYKVPPSAVIIGAKTGVNHKEFDLESVPTEQTSITYSLKGHFDVVDGVVNGRLESGKLAIAKHIPPGFPDSITRISFQVYYLRPVNGIDQLLVFPERPKDSDSLTVSLPLTPRASYSLPAGDFRFPLPAEAKLDRAWLTAALWDEMGFFPAQ
ncbi:MAG: hypothetical protein ACREDR_07530 [Blastocatellia bacterium]